MKTEVAAEISQQLVKIMGLLDCSVQFAKDNCTENEFSEFRLGIGRVMGALVLDVMNPLYFNNPEIKPVEYELDIDA